ncbi:MAG: type II toxin-antitoxin system YafQ family toxin [Eubacterium sp.]
MYIIKPSGRFKKDLKMIVKRGYNTNLLTEVIEVLAAGKTLSERFKDHSLTGNWVNHRFVGILKPKSEKI